MVEKSWCWHLWIVSSKNRKPSHMSPLNSQSDYSFIGVVIFLAISSIDGTKILLVERKAIIIPLQEGTLDTCLVDCNFFLGEWSAEACCALSLLLPAAEIPLEAEEDGAGGGFCVTLLSSSGSSGSRDLSITLSASAGSAVWKRVSAKIICRINFCHSLLSSPDNPDWIPNNSKQSFRQPRSPVRSLWGFWNEKIKCKKRTPRGAEIKCVDLFSLWWCARSCSEALQFSSVLVPFTQYTLEIGGNYDFWRKHQMQSPTNFGFLQSQN